LTLNYSPQVSLSLEKHDQENNSGYLQIEPQQEQFNSIYETDLIDKTLEINPIVSMAIDLEKKEIEKTCSMLNISPSKLFLTLS